MRLLILSVSIFFSLWVLCGVISYFIMRHFCMTTSGIKIPSFIRVALGFIMVGPIALFVTTCMLFREKSMGKCLEGNCFDGQGTILYPNGEKYVGEWKNGKYHGKGSYIYPDGRQIIGQWENDDFIGEENILDE